MPPDSSPSTALLPTLPLELVHHILRLSLPIPRLQTAFRRQRTLLAWSLVSRAMRHIAQRLLICDVWLPTWASAERFLAGLAEGTLDSKEVRVLRMTDWIKLLASARSQIKWNADEALMVRKILSRCKWCEELWIAGLSLDVRGFNDMPNIVQASFRSCTFVDHRGLTHADSVRPVTFLPKLSYLHLNDTIFRHYPLINLLSPYALPNLTHLELIEVRDNSRGPQSHFIDIAPQLKSLVMHGKSDMWTNLRDVELCENLEILSFSLDDTRALGWFDLPYSLKHVFVYMDPDEMTEEQLQHFEYLADTLVSCGLLTLTVSKPSERFAYLRQEADLWDEVYYERIARKALRSEWKTSEKRFEWKFRQWSEFVGRIHTEEDVWKYM